MRKLMVHVVIRPKGQSKRVQIPITQIISCHQFKIGQQLNVSSLLKKILQGSLPFEQLDDTPRVAAGVC
jgi:hypothetical protein